jgi:hypothetical protein
VSAGAWTLDHVFMGPGAAGEPHDDVPHTLTEAEKLANARAAVDAAERAGTRRVTPTSSPERPFGLDAEAAKLQRLREMEPSPLVEHPGVPADETEEGGRP